MSKKPLKYKVSSAPQVSLKSVRSLANCWINRGKEAQRFSMDCLNSASLSLLTICSLAGKDYNPLSLSQSHESFELVNTLACLTIHSRAILPIKAQWRTHSLPREREREWTVCVCVCVYGNLQVIALPFILFTATYFGISYFARMCISLVLRYVCIYQHIFAVFHQRGSLISSEIYVCSKLNTSQAISVNSCVFFRIRTNESGGHCSNSHLLDTVFALLLRTPFGSDLTSVIQVKCISEFEFIFSEFLSWEFHARAIQHNCLLW